MYWFKCTRKGRRYWIFEREMGLVLIQPRSQYVMVVIDQPTSRMQHLLKGAPY